MRYKILNKTILTSALVSLICLSAEQGFAQEVFDTESDDVLGVLPGESAVEAEDDIIPVSGEALIVPQAGEASNVKEENVPSKVEAPKEPVADVIKSQDNSSQENVILEKEEKIEAPIQADLLPVDDDFEVNFDGAADVVPAQPDPAKQRKHVRSPKNNSAQKHAPAARKSFTPSQANARGLQNKGTPSDLTFGDVILAQTNNDLFTQMSDIEKQTTLLTLELKKEKIKNEIEAAKAVREKVAFDKLASEEAKKRAQIEWEKEQEAKVFKAQTELKQKEIELEKIQQRKALTAYMNTMLEQKQSWVDENAKLYNEIKALRNKNTEMRQTYQKTLNDISAKMVDLMQSAETAQKDHDRALISLTAQNTQLKKRIEASQAAQSYDANGNPFASADGSNGKVQTSADSLIAPISVASEYAIVEILGQGDTLTVKLMNKDGDIFIAKQGTVLQTGHMVEEITPKFVRFSRNGLEDFLYTNSNAMEVEQSSLQKGDKASGPDPKKSVDKSTIIPLIQDLQKKTEDDDNFNLITESSLPSLGSTMFIK